MSTATLTPEQTITLLKHLTNGRPIAWVAGVLRLSEDLATAIATDHGYPEQHTMEWSIEHLTQQAHRLPHTLGSELARTAVAPQTPAHPAAGSSRTAAAAKTQPERGSAPASVPVPPIQPRMASTSAAEVLRQARESQSKRTQTLGTKISGLLVDLTRRLQTEQSQHEAAAEARRQEEEIRSAISKLEERAAALKAQPAQVKHAKAPTATDRPTTAVTAATPAKAMRTWATSQGITCPRSGPVPASVRQVYHQARTAGAA